MIAFLTSISWIGWLILGLLVLALWQLPALAREALSRNSDDTQSPAHPGEDPPHLNPGAHISSGASQHDTTPGADP